MTERTVASRVNTSRLRAIAIEAAEQSARLDVPDIAEPLPLRAIAGTWPHQRRLLVCDETGGGVPIADLLATLPTGPWAVLSGPEGGFTRVELDEVGILPFVCKVGLGPRILRAETAAIAALSVLQAIRGDGARSPPPRKHR
jgi:16S rRNA (uracil1498-N3)-methyltransferase